MQHRVAMPAHSARWLLSPVLGTGAGVGVGSAVGAGVGVAAVAGLPAVAGVHLPLVAGGVGYSHGQGDGFALIKGDGQRQGGAGQGLLRVGRKGAACSRVRLGGDGVHGSPAGHEGGVLGDGCGKVKGRVAVRRVPSGKAVVRPGGIRRPGDRVATEHAFLRHSRAAVAVEGYGAGVGVPGGAEGYGRGVGFAEVVGCIGGAGLIPVGEEVPSPAGGCGAGAFKSAGLNGTVVIHRTVKCWRSGAFA